MHKSDDVVSTLMEGVEVEVAMSKEVVELTMVMEATLQITKGSANLVQVVADKGGMVNIHKLMAKRNKPKNNHSEKSEKPKKFRASSAALHQTRAYQKSSTGPQTIQRNN